MFSHLSTTEWVSIASAIFFACLAAASGYRTWKKDQLALKAAGLLVKEGAAKADAAVALQATNVLELSAVLANMLSIVKNETIQAVKEAVGVLAKQLDAHAKQDAEAQQATNAALEAITDRFKSGT